jgi:hypothetical protein
MGGGLIQLALPTNNYDSYLSINPDISYYQYVYKRHTNFAMESRIEYLKNITMMPTTSGTSIYKCELSLSGDIDLINDMFVCFTLPEIYSSDKYKFRWIKNVGTTYVKSAKMYVDNILIDQTTGEWMNIWNELSAPVGDTRFDTLVGNVPELQDPKISLPRVSIKNNRFIYFYYPEGTANKPSIASRQILVPLNFWFTKNPAQSIPVFRFAVNGTMKHKLILELEMESSEKLYQVYSDKLGMYLSPSYYNDIHKENIDIYTFVNSNPYDINAYVEVNTVTLSLEERNYLIGKASLSYLVDQLYINNSETIPSSTSISRNINIQVQNPIKELVWVVKRNDLYRFNDFSNFSADIPESRNGILHSATITFNNNPRIEVKQAEYFSMIQPYQHHTKIPKTGIYCYSFSLYPEKDFLSGYFNGSATTVLNVSLQQNNNDYINQKLIKLGLQPYQFDYTVTVYVINYNIFEVDSDIPGMKFTLST